MIESQTKNNLENGEEYVRLIETPSKFENGQITFKNREKACGAHVISTTRSGMVGVSHGLQFNKLLSFSSIIFLNNNDLNPYKLPSSNY